MISYATYAEIGKWTVVIALIIFTIWLIEKRAIPFAGNLFRVEGNNVPWYRVIGFCLLVSCIGIGLFLLIGSFLGN